jgi:hypothetical protein
MSFIAITYGYNQFSIFNTNTSTLSLIDNIISICLDDINTLLEYRHKTLNKEIDVYLNDEENIKKEIKRLEANKQKEEEKNAEGNKQSDIKDPKKGKIQTKQPNKNENVNPITLIENELKSYEQKLQLSYATKEKYINKKDMLKEVLLKYSKIDRISLKIDLIDINGDRVNIGSKGDQYANLFLNDKQCYELNKITTSIIKFLSN